MSEASKGNSLASQRFRGFGRSRSGAEVGVAMGCTETRSAFQQYLRGSPMWSPWPLPGFALSPSWWRAAAPLDTGTFSLGLHTIPRWCGTLHHQDPLPLQPLLTPGLSSDDPQGAILLPQHVAAQPPW